MKIDSFIVDENKKELVGGAEVTAVDMETTNIYGDNVVIDINGVFKKREVVTTGDFEKLAATLMMNVRDGIGVRKTGDELLVLLGEESDLDKDGWRVHIKNHKGSLKVIGKAPGGQLCLRDFKATSIDISGLNTSSITSMKQMFECCNAQYIILAGIDTSNVTDMSYMFHSCKSRFVDMRDVDTSRVTSMKYMFRRCYIRNIQMDKLDTRNVKTMSHMFASSNICGIDISQFDTGNVVDMKGMFSGYVRDEDLDLSNFNTSQVRVMGGMFAGCCVNNLNLSSFDTSNVYNMQQMFSKTRVDNINISNFDTSNVITMSDMFSYSDGQLWILGELCTDAVIDTDAMFADCTIMSIKCDNKRVNELFDLYSSFVNKGIRNRR